MYSLKPDHLIAEAHCVFQRLEELTKVSWTYHRAALGVGVETQVGESSQGLTCCEIVAFWVRQDSRAIGNRCYLAASNQNQLVLICWVYLPMIHRVSGLLVGVHADTY